MKLDAMILVFWISSFKPAFSLFFHSHQEAFSSSLLSAIRLVLSACLRLLTSLPAILTPAYASSSLAFLMMYSAYKLNKQDDDKLPWHTTFTIWNQSVVSSPVLTVASWPAHRFLRWRSGGLLFPSLEEFSTVYCDPHSQSLWHSQESRSTFFFWNSLAFSMSQWMLSIWSLVPLPYLNPAWTSGSSQFMYCVAWLGEFQVILCLRVRWMQLCNNLNFLWPCHSLGLEWKMTFSSLEPLLSFPNVLAYWVHHFHSIIL